jgi:hypothetical protein
MSDEKRYPVPPQPAHLPAARPASVPALPSSAGGIAFSRRQRQEIDARFNRALADNLRARADAHRAAIEYSDARFDLAVALSRWNTLHDVIAHEERKGFLKRTSEIKVLMLELETQEINARINRDAAMLSLTAYQPQPPSREVPPPSAPPPPPALSAAEIRKAAQMMPEFENKPEAIDTLVLMLSGLMAEKNK